MIRSGQFEIQGVVWRRLLRWAILNMPLWLEPVMVATWAAVFLLWGPGRRGVMSNLSAILPGSSAAMNFFRTYAVVWNFAWTIADNVRFKEFHISPDWEFAGLEYFEQLQAHEGGAIILTAHMGSYDLGAQLFAEVSQRQIVMVRAPERDPQTRQYEEDEIGRTSGVGLRVDFNTGADELAIGLLQALRRSELLAVQGDRVTAGLSSLPATLFGKTMEVPAGPFALAMTARVPIFPLFILRLGRRRYRLVVRPPFHVVRTAQRSEAFEKAVSHWSGELEETIRGAWSQWFAFEPFSPELRG